MLGKIPNVLKMAMHKNQARWLFLPAFHIAIIFPTESQIPIIMISAINHGNIDQ
jgi:hypothetical protein